MIQPQVQTQAPETPVASNGIVGSGLNEKDQHGTQGSRTMSPAPQHIQPCKTAS